MNTFRGNQAPITCRERIAALTMLFTHMPCSAVKHSPDGKWVVSGDAAGVVRVHDLEASKLLHTFTPARKGSLCAGTKLGP